MDLMARRRMMMEIGGSPTPPAPTPVFYDRLVFDGTAYIDTDIIPPANSSFNVRLGDETLKVAQRLFSMSGANGSSIGAIIGTGTTTTRRYFSIYYGASSAVSAGSRYLAWSTTTYNFFITPNRFGWGSTSYTFTKGANSPVGGIVFGSNTSHSGQIYTGTMGTFNVYGTDAQNVSNAANFANYTPIATFRPCTYNGEAGMWYVQGNKFYGNTAGSGILTVENI